MSDDARAGTVIVVASDATQAARVEAALHGLTGWRRIVCTPGRLRAVFAAEPTAVVVVALEDGETQRLLRTIRGWPRSPTIVALSDDPARLWTPASRTLGLRAALPRGVPPEQLAGAVHAVDAGLLVLHDAALTPSPLRRAPSAAGAPLTAREREILELMAEGANNRVIASRLGISPHTVKFHVASILAKLSAGSRTEAVALALRRGLLIV